MKADDPLLPYRQLEKVISLYQKIHRRNLKMTHGYLCMNPLTKKEIIRLARINMYDIMAIESLLREILAHKKKEINYLLPPDESNTEEE